MPTNQNAYNSRVTDEALEKKFRDTFRSQGGAELVDDLYASGVIIPVVDFSDAAAGSQLQQNLQTAWDFSTGFNKVNNATGTTLINTTGFWQVDLTATVNYGGTPFDMFIFIDSGVTTKKIWQLSTPNTLQAGNSVTDGHFVVYLRAGDTLKATAANASLFLNVWYRQIADVSGNLTNPFGFTSS